MDIAVCLLFLFFKKNNKFTSIQSTTNEGNFHTKLLQQPLTTSALTVILNIFL